MVNGAPFRPERCCWKKTGPGEVNLMASAMSGNSRNQINNSSKMSAPTTIHDLFDDALPRRLRRGAKNEQRPAEQFVEAGAGNLGREKIGDQPDFDAFEFAGLDDVFNLLEISMFGVQDHAVDRMIMEHFHNCSTRRFD